MVVNVELYIMMGHELIPVQQVCAGEGSPHKFWSSELNSMLLSVWKNQYFHLWNWLGLFHLSQSPLTGSCLSVGLQIFPQKTVTAAVV